MTTRASRDVVHRHRARVQQIVSCVSGAFVSISEPAPRIGEVEYSIALNNGVPTPLVRNILTLRIVQSFVTPITSTPGDVHVTGYNYTLNHSRYGEVFAYHWHRRTPQTPAHPHLHMGVALVGTDGHVRTGDAHKVHFSTGPVSLESFLRLLITEFGVEPRRSNWEAILSDG